MDSEEEAMKCAWSEDEEGIWWTDCDNYFTFVDGSPEDNGMKFCCYCGKPIGSEPLLVPAGVPDEEDANAERAPSGQHTLGSLIVELRSMSKDAVVANLAIGGSYRGCYSDLYLWRGAGTRPAQELLLECGRAQGKSFDGYKGGRFAMGLSTPLWIANYGVCGVKLMEVREGGEIETAKDEL